MSITIAGYQILPLPIHEGVKTVIYRGMRESAQTPVIIKTVKGSYPTLEDITRLRHEFKILQHLDGFKGIVKPIALENYQNGLALILSDFGADSLKNFIASHKVDLIRFLKIAIQLADALENLHQNNIIHKDIKTHNILINTATNDIKIIDFSIATRLAKENQTWGNPNLLEGTLAYISPEQTGRMNRSIDYRTDFYSLGVTFYEILTGQLPFKTTDLMELVHCHIAKQPVPLHQLNPEIPLPVSSIVMKLLAKNAEERYQSAVGLKVDLEECLTQLLSTGKIENFIPGQRDKSGQFLIPQKLYGREAEVAQLLDAFERVSEGTTEMMLISGYSGIGKSCLVHEVHKPIVRQRGYFIAGKFDQLKRNIPYAAVIQAFSDLMRQLLTESLSKIAFWKEKLLEAFGQNGQVIIDVIPEVELIIGEQQTVPQLGPTESQNRLNLLFQQFIHVFTQPEHPLVLFLDDLQWADSASLKLIQVLVTDPDSQYLLLMGAYRDNEVSPTHPLMHTLNEIQKTRAIVHNITVQPLDITHISQLIADTLGESCDSPVPPTREGNKGGETPRSKPLAELLFNKTQGNPFFLTQLLQTLYGEKLLHFDFIAGRWLWDIEQIQAIGITDYNVVELVARNIQKLSEETVRVLKLAACIGNQFNLGVLAIVNEKSLSTTASDLWSALQAGLILPLSHAYKIPLFCDQSEQSALTVEDFRVEYKFLHDRVQQAAYSLIPSEQKKATHLKIGQMLLQKTNRYAQEENIFDIVNQLNMGVEFITHQAAKNELAGLNLIAGRKAKAATAYETALNCLTVALGLLAEDSWQSHYELSLNLYVETAEAEYLNTNFEGAASLALVILQQATTLLDRVKVYELQIQFFMAQNQMLKAIDTGLSALEMLGVSLSSHECDERVVFELPKLEDLENIPVMTDLYQLAAMRILMTIAPPIHAARPDILPLVALTMIHICIEHGYSPLAAYAYGIYGLSLCGVKGKLDTAYHSGCLALKLLDKFDAKSLTCKVFNLFYGHIIVWKQHARETISPLLEGIQSGLETGDIEVASYCSFHYCTHLFLIGEHLETVNKQQAQYIDLLLKLKQEFAIYYTKIWGQLTLNLIGEAQDQCRLIGESFDESVWVPHWRKVNNHFPLFAAFLAKTILFYLFKDYTQAVEQAFLAAEYSEAAAGVMTVAVHNFYYSLTLLAQYPNVSNSEQQQYMSKVTANQEKMQQWASHAPANFQHKYELVEAEKARVLGNYMEAIALYEQAITGAKEQGYIQEEALFKELAGEFHLSRGQENLGRFYIIESYYAYIRWGAVAKVKHLESTYPQFLSRINAQKTADIDVYQTTTTTKFTCESVLDLATVMKASLAISGEIVLSQLLSKLMKIVIENAGAQKGFLILNQSGNFVISASGEVDEDEVTVLQSPLVEMSQAVPMSVLNYVQITQKSVVLNNANSEGVFTTDPYIIKTRPKSVLCNPIINQGKLIGLLYLENNLTFGVFTPQRLEVLKLLSSQAAISLENAQLYTNLKAANAQLEDYSRNLEVKVKKRTLELQEKNKYLHQTLQDLKQTQTQLIQTEKMSSLGQMVAGVAHEINNPINFIYGNITHAHDYTQDVLNLLNLYQQHYPNPVPDIQAKSEAIDLEFLMEDLPKMLNSMKVGADRIRKIVLSLRNFSRLDEAQIKAVDIHEGLDSTLLMLQHRLKASSKHPAIEVIKEYGNLPLIECCAGQLNQVFMNILANAIDVLEECNSVQSPSEIKRHPGTIRIRTELSDRDKVAIRIADNGPGMTQTVLLRVFDPFFTTKPQGKGTGLGLSISYQIVVEKHRGVLKCFSQPGHGAEFLIEIPTQQSSSTKS